MDNKKPFRPQNMRTLLTTLLVIAFVGGGAAFYWGLGLVREYATTVNQRLVDAKASGEQVQALQALKSQLNQSTTLVDKANLLFATPDTYQAQVLNDIRRHADAAGISVTTTNFSPAGEGTPSVTIALRQPVTYTQLITFLSNIESNLPKLQVSSISLGTGTSGSNSISVGDIKIDIAVR